LNVSEIAFGGVEIGIPYGINVQGRADMPSEQQALDLLHTALDCGINFFDNAHMYGQSETLMGKAFKGLRDQVVINTKCIHLRDSEKHLYPASEIRRMIPESMQTSLNALQTDHVDIFMTHSCDMEILDQPEVLEGFDSLRKKGYARAIGVSTYTPAETQKAIDSGLWDVIQLPFNLMDQRQAECFPSAAKNGVGIMVRSVLLKGILSDRGKNLHPALQGITDHRKRLLQIINGNESDLPRFATRFALSFPEVSSVLVGIDRKEYLFAALQSAEGAALGAEMMHTLRESAYPDPEFINLAVWDRKGWLH